VVIGIIAVLIGILLPTISRARKQANTTACMATLRNLGQAMFVYAAENRGSLPYSYYVSAVLPAQPVLEGDSGNASVYVWWSVLRAYMRKGSNLDNSVINADGSTSTRFMKAFACPEGHDPDAGNDYGSNMIIMPEMNWENDSFLKSVNTKNFGCKPCKVTLLYPDNILLFDSTEISDTDPPYSRQYVCGYEVDGSSFSFPKKAYQRYRQMAADPNYIAPGTALANDSPIASGTNKEAITTASGQRGNIRWRHGKEDLANFLFSDGTVRSMRITKGTPGQPGCTGDVTHAMWRPKSPNGFRPTG